MGSLAQVAFIDNGMLLVPSAIARIGQATLRKHVADGAVSVLITANILASGSRRPIFWLGQQQPQTSVTAMHT